MDILFDSGVTDKISAVNACLSAIGSVGINSEEELEWNIDASDADKYIGRYSQIIQANRGKGWWFNREEFHKFTPDKINGYVVLPSNTISCYIQSANGSLVQVTTRDGKLFDPKKTGYDMRPNVGRDGEIHCTLIINLPFNSLPITAMQAVTDTSCFWFVNDKEGDTNKMNSYMRAAQDSMISLNGEDSSQKRRNLLENRGIRNAMYRIGGYNNVR